MFNANERNPLYAYFVAKFGFKAGSLLQFMLVEAPALIILAYLPIPLLYWFITGRQPSLLSSISAAMTLFLAAHIHACLQNMEYEKKMRKRIVNYPSLS